MKNLMTRASRKAGLEPGTSVLTGGTGSGDVRISIIAYDDAKLDERSPSSVDDCRTCRDDKLVTWTNIDGVHNPRLVEEVGLLFNIHPLVLEDIVNVGQRPKLEDFGDYLYIVLKMLRLDSQNGDVLVEQVSLILGQNYVLSFQERPGDVFDPIRERLRKSRGRLRKSGADFLVYSLMDAIVDQYFTIIECVGDRIEALEEALLDDPNPSHMKKLHELKNTLIFLRRSVWPLRELVSGLERGDSRLVRKSTTPFLRDLYDHNVRIIESIETCRDLLSGMLELYISTISNRTNEVMKVLTVIATIFIPLSFIAGIYGMNLKSMPELDWDWSYIAFWLAVFTISASMLLYFKRKKWI